METTSKIAVVLTVVAGCGSYKPVCNTREAGWCVTEESASAVPQAYLDEVAATIEVLGLKPGDLTISLDPNTTGYKSIAYSATDVGVVYDPAVGLGPAPGTTALEWQMCCVAQGVRCGLVTGADEDASACAAQILPEVVALLEQQ